VTELAPKKALIAFLLIIFAVSALILFAAPHKTEAPKKLTGDQCTTIGDICYNLERAETNDARLKGLSGRENLPETSGMLFVFDVIENQCMWMKDMKISNDMIWLDETKKVIKIQENVAPETYPNAFCSEKPAKYVIELNAGQVKRSKLELGSAISL
jgi:uncharacterized membrane protein (UPF0127 family)